MSEDETLAHGPDHSPPHGVGKAETTPGSETVGATPRPVTGALPQVHAAGTVLGGRYRLLQRVGAGGMGEVYDAQQTEPIRRRVAIKVIKRGMDTEAVVARFESERQALALMDHDCIAKVFDAGITPDGRPFFAMEYVKGIAITEYCEKHEVPTRDRLKLFIHICEGVQHAHQKGIIHRDLKPSNVLVTVKEGRPAPKIIDFGLAKATVQSLTEREVFTELGQMMGTPEYMSPEQAEMSGLDVDTRTDVYSLGVILYELLTGALPFDSQSLRAGSFEDIRRKIRESEPPKPSTRLGTIISSSGDSAPRHRSALLARTRQLRGDLDWVVMMAMEKDRTRRYPSASDLAADIGRHLRNEPVSASPPSSRYRIRKFVQRHKVGVAMGVVLSVAVLLGTVGTTVEWLRARRAERLAHEEAETARQIADFLVGLFQVSDPNEAVGNTITAREILDQGSQKVHDELGDQPVTQARLMHTMGEVYKSLGLYDAARPLLEQALERRLDVHGESSIDVAESLAGLADLYRLEANFVEAEPLLLRALATREAELGPDHPDVAHVLCDLATAYSRQGKHDEAEPLFQRALSIRESVLGPQDPEVARSLNNLGILYWRQGKYDRAEPMYKRALAIWEKSLGEDHPEVARGLNNLAILYRRQGKLAAAVPLYERAVAIYEKTLGPEHPRLASGINNLALVYYNQGDYASAEPLYERAVKIAEASLGTQHPDLAKYLKNLANLKKDQDDVEGAEPLLRRSVEILEVALGSEHPDLAWALGDLGILYRGVGDLDAAEPLFRRALAIFETTVGPESDGVAWTLNDLGVLFRQRGKLRTAENYFKRALDTFDIALGPQNPAVAECLDNYALLLRDMQRPAAADSVLDLAAAIREASSTP
jgi:non-specific serine/threonine protein kinase/serine/threonine-protein kinase